MPPWGSWWVLLGLLLVLIALYITLYVRRVRQTRVHQRQLEREIQERRRIEQEQERLLHVMEEKNAELEAKNAELVRFTYTVSHDLKSPLITIRGFLGLLEQDVAQGNTERMRQDIEQINNAAMKMQHLLKDLLNLSRAGRVINPPEPVPLGEVAGEAAALVSGLIKKKQISVVIQPDLPVVNGDRIRLLEVYLNLIENAARFIGDGPHPRIVIGGRRQQHRLVCYVRDNGIGIDPCYHKKVFNLFEQLNPEEEGTGIGLALVKRIIEVHGGRIWVESEGPGRGTTLAFVLPELEALNERAPELKAAHATALPV